MKSARSFAILPAAGHSRRMGRPKLLLPWNQTTVIEQVLTTWKSSRVDGIVIVVRDDDTTLAEVCGRLGVDVVRPLTDPPDMKTSVQHALKFVEQKWCPADSDVWLLAPADLPNLPAATIDQLLSTYQSGDPTILVPAIEGRRGHPLLLPWKLSHEVFPLPDDAGVNALLAKHRVREVECTQEGIFDELNTPQDYDRIRRRDSESD